MPLPTLAEDVPSRAIAPETGIAADDMVTRKRLRLNRDPSRVIVKLFVPGTLSPGPDSRAQGVVDRALALSEEEADAAYQRIADGFSTRHRDLERTFDEHYHTVRTASRTASSSAAAGAC